MTEVSDDSPLFCDRCMRQLSPGRGDFYVVHIEAYADPSPPTFDEQSLGGDLKEEIAQLVAQLQDVSERESLDQVYRRMTIHLCQRCYRDWIENPTGSSG